MSSNLLKKYFNHSLLEDERFLLEKEALNDDFLFEAWEGVNKHSKTELAKSYKVLDQKLNANSIKNRRLQVFLYPVAIAASLMLLIATIYIFIPSQKESNIPVTALTAPEDLINNELQSTQKETNPVVMDQENAFKQAEPLNKLNNKSSSLSKKSKQDSSPPDKDKMLLANKTSTITNDQANLSEQLAPKAAHSGIDSKSSEEIYNESNAAKRSIISETSPISHSLSLARTSSALADSLPCSPAQGLVRLNQLIEDEKKIKKEDLFMRKIKSPATVILGFFVNENGSLIDLKIISSPSEYLNEEAIRLMQIGGKWTSPGPSFQCSFAIVF